MGSVRRVSDCQYHYCTEDYTARWSILSSPAPLPSMEVSCSLRWDSWDPSQLDRDSGRWYLQTQRIQPLGELSPMLTPMLSVSAELIRTTLRTSPSSFWPPTFTCQPTLQLLWPPT